MIYTAFNISLACTFACLIFSLLFFFKIRGDNILAARVATMVTLLSYPWDFFAIFTGAWDYPNDPGPRIYGVPANDMIFIWLCSFFTGYILTAVDQRKKGGKRHSESE